MDSDVRTDSLRERIDRAVARAEFQDVYRNNFDSSGVRLLYRAKRRCPLSSADSIRVPNPELDALASELGVLLVGFTSPDSGSVGNGLYHLMGSLASPRLPVVEDYAKMLVLAASRIGSERVLELLTGWLRGGGIRIQSCVLLKGIETEGKLAPVDGMRLETLPTNGDDFPRSLHLDRVDIEHEQFAKRAMLSIEYETVSPLYDPRRKREGFPGALPRATLANPDLSTVSIEGFCRAMSLQTNNHVDWFMQWEDYGDVEAFFLNAGFSSRRKEASNSSPILVSEEDLGMCLEIHARLHGFSALDQAIARWRRSKCAITPNDQLIELRIALESVLLSDKGSVGEKRHRLAIQGAWFLGETFDKRKGAFRHASLFLRLRVQRDTCRRTKREGEAQVVEDHFRRSGYLQGGDIADCPGESDARLDGCSS